MGNRLRRRSIRLKGFDYSQPGAYFITLCTWHKIAYFGCLENDEMMINVFGRIVRDEVNRLPARFPNIRIGTFAVMPDHVHMVIEIIESRGTTIVQADPVNRVYNERSRAKDKVDRCAPMGRDGACRGTTVVQADPLIGVDGEPSRAKDKVDRCAPTRL